MKIIKTNFIDGEARFVFEELPERAFCVKLEGKTTQAEVLEALKLMLPEEAENQETYNNLKIKELEGTEIARN